MVTHIGQGTSRFKARGRAVALPLTALQSDTASRYADMLES